MDNFFVESDRAKVTLLTARALTSIHDEYSDHLKDFCANAAKSMMIGALKVGVPEEDVRDFADKAEDEDAINELMAKICEKQPMAAAAILGVLYEQLLTFKTKSVNEYNRCVQVEVQHARDMIPELEYKKFGIKVEPTTLDELKKRPVAIEICDIVDDVVKQVQDGIV